MTWILIIVIGGILGWIASKIMRTDAQQGVFLNIVVGIIGAARAGFLLSCPWERTHSRFASSTGELRGKGGRGKGPCFGSIMPG